MKKGWNFRKRLDKLVPLFLRKELGKRAEKFLAELDEEPFDRLTAYGFDVQGNVIVTIHGERILVNNLAKFNKVVKDLVKNITVPEVVKNG